MASGSPCGDDPAEIEHRDAVAHAQHERDVVLDEEHGHPPVLREPAHEMAELGGLVLAEARRGFVEKQH